MRPLAIVGVTRFSVDPLSIIRQSLPEDEMLRRQSATYSPDRLSSKLDLFEKFTLPSLRAASELHEDFFHLIAYSSELPASITARLDEIYTEHKCWLQLLKVQPHEALADVLRMPIRSLSKGRRLFNFRIDDDDAISPDFVTATLVAAEECPDGTVLSFDIGIYVQRIAGDEFIVHEFDYPKIAIGLGVFSGPECVELVFDLPVHHKIPQHRTRNIRDRHYWLRTLHSHNDSGTRAQNTQPVTAGDAYTLLSPRFAHLQVDALNALPIATGNHRFEDAPKVLLHIQ
jgi:hypothetical protein